MCIRDRQETPSGEYFFLVPPASGDVLADKRDDHGKKGFAPRACEEDAAEELMEIGPFTEVGADDDVCSNLTPDEWNDWGEAETLRYKEIARENYGEQKWLLPREAAASQRRQIKFRMRGQHTRGDVPPEGIGVRATISQALHHLAFATSQKVVFPSEAFNDKPFGTYADQLANAGVFTKGETKKFRTWPERVAYDCLAIQKVLRGLLEKGKSGVQDPKQ